MTTQKNKEVLAKLYDLALNKNDMTLLPELISADYPGLLGDKGPAAFAKPITGLINAFPGIQWTIEEMIGEGNKIAVRWKLQGTQVAPFNGFAAIGKTVTNEGMAIYEFKDGKIIGAHVLTDRLGFLQQLEALPQDITQLSGNKEHVYFIDKFYIPSAGKKEFTDRTNINREMIKKLPGFIKDAAYAYTDQEGNLLFITVAEWASMEALKKAKETVQAEYKKQGFDAAEMLKRLNITVDRGVYTTAN